MGGNASSLIADLTLSMIEFRYLKTLKPVLNYRGQRILSVLVHQNNVSGKTVFIMHIAIWLPCHMVSSKMTFLDSAY
jgi:hypothetical protein